MDISHQDKKNLIFTSYENWLAYRIVKDSARGKLCSLKKISAWFGNKTIIFIWDKDAMVIDRNEEKNQNYNGNDDIGAMH